MSINQKQIAEKLGVSISLVSRVLSGCAKEIGIAQATIDQVTEVAREMGYVPNVAARALKGKSTKTIGVVVYDFKDPFFGILVHHLQVLAHENGYTLLLVGFQNRIPSDRDLQPLLKFNLDGIIAIGSDFAESWFKQFNHLPCARIGFGNETAQSLKVTSDESLGYAQLVAHLRSSGITRAAFLGANADSHRHRCDFFTKAAEALSVSAHFSDDFEHHSFEIGKTIASQLLAQGDLDALVCANDRIAMGAIHAAKEAGVLIPKGLKIVGYDDIPAAAQFLPPLTTIRQPIAAIVKEVFYALISGNCPGETRQLAPKLIIRQTT